MEKKLKVGCIGLGARGSYLFSTLIMNPNVVPYAVCDMNRGALETYKNVLENEKKISGVKYFTSYKYISNMHILRILVVNI